MKKVFSYCEVILVTFFSIADFASPIKKMDPVISVGITSCAEVVKALFTDS